KIREIIEKELGALPTRFSQFDDIPVAAASLGQVHRARLHNGDRVVVKVQRPGIAEICHTDLAAMNVVAHIAMRFRFISRRMDAVALIQEFGRVLLEELSYKHEAQNAIRFTQMFKDDLGVYIPTVYTEHSTDCVITIEDVTTIKLDDYEALEAAGISRKAVASRLMQTYLKQIFEERFFHADPHPGNLFVYPLPEDSETALAQDWDGGKPFYLIFIDFGMIGTLTQQIVNGLVGTMAAVVTRDSKKLIQSYSELGFLLPGADTDRLEEATRAVFDQVWGLTMEQMSSVNFDDMAAIGKEFSDLLFSMPFQVPQDFIYLGRTVGILSGLCTSLDPSFNPWSEMQPYTQKLITGRYGSPGGEQPLFGSPILQSLFGGNGGSALLGIGQTLIGRALAPQSSTVLARLESGELKLRVEAASGLQQQLTRIEGQGKKTSRAVIFGAFMVTSTLFYVNGDIALAVIGYVVSGVSFVVLMFTGE
ncbi:MAG: AarF/ABC1/UbiB kinase family protein, partial [Anaerolinea sp.]|nr:AarF/ABC1/UbiB kinase family protein [Anaerolinea sp.]